MFSGVLNWVDDFFGDWRCFEISREECVYILGKIENVEICGKVFLVEVILIGID